MRSQIFILSAINCGLASLLMSWPMYPCYVIDLSVAASVLLPSSACINIIKAGITLLV